MSVASPIVRPLFRPLFRSVFRGSAFDPVSLFANGEPGAFYLPEPQYLYQDSAGTIPVTADGDPVGYMQDLSGNGNHAIQATSGSKPLYRTDGTLHWLEYDGFDDGIHSTTTDFMAGTQSSHVFASSLNSEEVVYKNPAGTGYGDFTLRIGITSLFRIYNGLSATVGFLTQRTDSALRVLSGYVIGDSAYTWQDGVLVDSKSPLAAALNFADQNAGQRLDIGSTSGNSNFSSGKFFGLVITNNVLSAADREKTEEYLANKAGVTL